MDPEAIGTFGGWIGAGIGIVGGISGGVIGTYFPYKNARSDRERVFVLKFCSIAWVLIMAFVLAMFLISSWHKHLLWVPYALFLFVAARMWNKTQLRIQQQQSGDAA